MQRDELIEVVQRVAAAWPHSAGNFEEPTLALWWDTLKVLSKDEATAAVESLYREGREHAPTGGMILKRATELGLDAPQWAEAANELKRCLAFGEQAIRAGVITNERQQRLEQCPPSVRAFVERLGWRQIENWDSADPAAEAQLRNKWQAFVQGNVEDLTLEGLPSGGLRRLERVNGPRQIGEALKELERSSA